MVVVMIEVADNGKERFKEIMNFAVDNNCLDKILNQLHKLYRKDPELSNSLKAVADANQQLNLGLEDEIKKHKLTSKKLNEAKEKAEETDQLKSALLSKK